MSPSSAVRPLDNRGAGFRRRKVLKPIVEQPRKRLCAGRIALTTALGVMLGILPSLGATAFLRVLAASFLSVNQPSVQLTNCFADPLQLALIIPISRAGETSFGQTPVSLSLPPLVGRFRARCWQFLMDFAQNALQSVAVCCRIATVVVPALCIILRPAFPALARCSAAR